MDPNLVPALVAALAGTPFAPLVVYAPLAVALAAILSAALPHPAPGSPWAPLRAVLDLLAVNVGNAKNAAPPPSAPPAAGAAALALLACLGLSACGDPASAVACTGAEVIAIAGAASGNASDVDKGVHAATAAANVGASDACQKAIAGGVKLPAKP